MDNVTRIRTADSQAAVPPALDPAQPPLCNIEAEQAILGAILSNNDVYSPVSEVIGAEHFFDPVHAGLFELLSERMDRNSRVSPVTLKTFVENVRGLAEVGGVEYLFKLAESAISVHASRDYAKEVYDLARRRELVALGREISDKAAKIEARRTVADLIHESEVQLYRLSETGQRDTGFQSFLKAATAAVEQASVASKRKSGLAGLPTGFIDLDSKLGGLHPSDLVIVAGRPSMGKTALATNIAFHVARNHSKGGFGGSEGGYVGFFSLEMSSAQLAARILAETSRITTSQLRRSQLNADDFQRYALAARDLQSVPLFIDDTPALTISQIATRARRMKEMHNLHLLVVDYLQLVRPTADRDSRVNEVSEISRGLKAIAKDLDIPVIAVSQLSRQVENRDDKRPQLADLRDSGSIEQDADVVMFVFRQEYYQERTKPDEDDAAKMEKWRLKMDAVSGLAEIIIGKQRHGPIGTVDLTFESKFTLFGNKAKPGFTDPGANSNAFAH